MLLDANQKLKWAVKTKGGAFDAVVTELTRTRYLIQLTKGSDCFDVAVPGKWIDDCEVGRPVPEPLDAYIEWLEARFMIRRLRKRGELKRR
jgi:hypothetical protein